ncbi:MAG: ABC transporter permease subunit [Collinsella sp.]
MRPFTAAAGVPVPPAKAALNYLAVCVVVIAVVWASLAAAGISLNFDFVAQYRVRIWDGFCMTVGISAASLVLSLVLGVLVAAGQGVRFLPLRYLCDFYVKIIRGTPLIVQVYFFYYHHRHGLGHRQPGARRHHHPVAILGRLHRRKSCAAACCRWTRGKWRQPGPIGFTRAQTLRYVVAPQLVARTLPALTGQMASIIKDSSLLSVIAVIELTQTMREITATNYNFFGGFLLLGALYLVVHAAHHGGKPPLREEARLCALGQQNICVSRTPWPL